MSSEKWSLEVETSVAAIRMFKASMVDWHNLGPKVLPDIIVSGTPVSGDGSAGSIRQLNYASVLPFTYTKERLEFIDHGTLECKSSLIEGGVLGTKLESASFHFKVESAGNGGCVVKVVATYKALPGVDIATPIAETKKNMTGMFKATEAYLVANPTAYA